MRISRLGRPSDSKVRRKSAELSSLAASPLSQSRLGGTVTRPRRFSRRAFLKGMLPEDEMRKVSVAAAVALMLSCLDPATYAQTPAPQEPVTTSHKLNLT